MDIQVENSEQFFNPPFDTQVNCPFVIVRSPMNQHLLENKSFKELQGVVSEQIKKMIESQHFRKDKQITVKMGIQSPDNPYQGKHDFVYKAKESDIRHFEELLGDYSRAQTVQDLDKIMNEQVLKERRENINVNLCPIVLIQGTRKRGFYAKLNQQFNDKGFASFGATIGYWNPFKLNDKIQANYEGGINEKVWKKFNFHNYALKWMIPKWKGTLEFQGAYSFNWIARGLYEGTYHFSPKYLCKQYNIGLQIAKRSILIDTKSEGNLGYFARNYLAPSNKLSLKLNKDLTQTLVHNSDGIPDGQTSDIHIQSTIPYLSGAQFVKLDYHYRRYFDLYIHSRGWKNSIIKKALQNSSFEVCSSVNAVYNRTNYLSDYIRSLTMRGFETSDMPNESSVNLKASLKWNIHNFPVLKQARIRAFLYYQAGVTFERFDARRLIPSIKSAGGWGFSFPLNNAAHLQVIYNLFQHQINSTARPTNFQIRIGFND